MSARIHEELARRVVEGVGDHGFDDGDVVHNFGEVWEEFGDFGAALTVLLKFELWTEKSGIGIDEGGAIAFQEFGRWESAIELSQLRLVVKEFEMTGSTGHEKKDDVFGFGGEWRFFGSERITFGSIGETGFGQQIE